MPVEHGLIDACAFHDWPGPQALVPYMRGDWGEMIGGGGPESLLGIKSIWRYAHPLGDKAPETYPEHGPPGSDLPLLLEQVLGDERTGRAVLGYHDGLLSTSYPLPYVAREVCRAVNDWTLHEWLARDERLFGHLLVVSALPEEAAAEIARLGSDERFVAIALGANGLARGFGHPAYHPIFEAAVELDLPLVLQASSDAMNDSIPLPTAVGLPGTYAEFDVHSGHALMSHVASLIMGGVFDLFPDLRILLVGGGVAWVPWYCWNLDWCFKFMRRVEAPWLTGLPSEYFLRHVRLGTYSLEHPRQPERLETLLSTIPGIERMLLYTSGYPNADGEPPDAIAARLPAAWHEGIFRDNAAEFYRWPADARSPVSLAADDGGTG